MALDTRQLTGLLYSMGRTFDNLSSTYMATEEFLRTNNAGVVGSKADLALLEDLRDAARYALHHDGELDVDFVQGINASLSRTAALEPGQLRQAQNIMVHTTSGDYIPPIPDRGRMQSSIDEANHGDGDLHSASTLFASLARMQPFGDGNKRTALLAANRLLADRGVDRALIVPTQDPERVEFNDLMGAWYVQDNPKVIDWLAEYNEGIEGLDDYGHAIAYTADLGMEDGMPQIPSDNTKVR